MQIVCITFITSGFSTASKLKLPKSTYHMISKRFFKTTIDGKISGKVYMFENIVAKIKRGLPWKCCSKFIALQQDVKSVIPAIKSEKWSGFKFSSPCVLFALQGCGILYRKNI